MAMAQWREIIADSKKLLQRSQDMHQGTEHQQIFNSDPSASVHFAAIFVRSMRILAEANFACLCASG